MVWWTQYEDIRSSGFLPSFENTIAYKAIQNCLCLVTVTDGVKQFRMIGLAPEIPEDLYMLIKKVCKLLPS